MADLALPYGMRDVKLTPYTGDEVLGTAVDLPNARTFSFSEAEEFETLRGDDKVVAIRGAGASVAWDLEAGGISLAAYKVLAGGTVVISGVTPVTVQRYTKKVTDERPYFKVEGQAISDNGGDFHAIVWKCRTTGDLEGELSDGAFWLTAGSGEGLPPTKAGATKDVLYEFINNETAVAIGAV